MTKTETARLLAVISAFDRRTVGEAEVEAWYLVVGDLTGEDCAHAVREHYARTTDWLMPAHVRAGVRRMRAERLDRELEPVPDADPDDVSAYLTALRAGRRRIAAGDEKPRPVGALTVGHPMSEAS